MTTEFTSYYFFDDSLCSEENPHLENMTSDDKDELIGDLYNEVARLQRVIDALMTERDQLVTALGSRQADNSNSQGNVGDYSRLEHDGHTFTFKLEEILVSHDTLRRSGSGSGSDTSDTFASSSDSDLDSFSTSYLTCCGTPSECVDADIDDHVQSEDLTEQFEDCIEEDTWDEHELLEEELDMSLLVSNRTHFLNNTQFEMPTPRTGWEKYARRTFIPCLSVIPETGDFLITFPTPCSNLDTTGPVEMFIEEISRCASSLGFNPPSEGKSWFDMTMEDEEDEFW